MEVKEKYDIIIEGDVKKIIPKINATIEAEKKRLARYGIHFNITRRFKPKI